MCVAVVSGASACYENSPYDLLVPGHRYGADPVRQTRPRATPTDARRKFGPLSKGRCAPYPKLGALLATVALAVRLSHGTASSPKTMGRVLVHLAMLSTASGWSLPSLSRGEEDVAPLSSHESTVTGEEVGRARDRRRLVGSSCDAWSVSPRPHLSFPLLHA